MTLHFAHKNAFTVVGLAGQFTMVNNSIPQLWKEFNRKANQVKHAIHTSALGVCFYDADYDSCDDTPFTYMAGWAVSKVEDVPEGWSVREIPAADYAVFEHKGALDTLKQTYDSIFRDWMPASEFDVAPHDDFELYDERFMFGHPDSVMEIWMPIKKK